jgi:hypothetical protein
MSRQITCFRPFYVPSFRTALIALTLYKCFLNILLARFFSCFCAFVPPFWSPILLLLQWHVDNGQKHGTQTRDENGKKHGIDIFR